MIGHAPAAIVAGRRRNRRDADSLSCCRPRTRSGSARNWPGASASPSGSSRSPPPTPIGSRSGWRGRSPAAAHAGVQLVLSRHGGRDLRHPARRPDVARAGNIGPPVDPAVTTRVVEFNDLSALETALAPGDVACVLAEPAMTNIGIVLPDAGFHAALSDMTRRTGTLLIIDETHTISAGPEDTPGRTGCSRTCSRSARPWPAAFLGQLRVHNGGSGADRRVDTDGYDRHRRNRRDPRRERPGYGCHACHAAKRSDRGELPPHDSARHPLCRRCARSDRRACLPWTVQQLGCRAEYWFRPVPPRNGSEAAASADPDLERFMHLSALNRGILLTPFHNMALIAPTVTEDDVDRHTGVFRESIARL